MYRITIPILQLIAILAQVLMITLVYLDSRVRSSRFYRNAFVFLIIQRQVSRVNCFVLSQNRVDVHKVFFISFPSTNRQGLWVVEGKEMEEFLLPLHPYMYVPIYIHKASKTNLETDIYIAIQLFSC